MIWTLEGQQSARKSMATHLDVVAAEKRCISMVVNGGIKLQFALSQVGLSYKAKTPQYHRIRRKIRKEKEKKNQRTGIVHAIMFVMFYEITDLFFLY